MRRLAIEELRTVRLSAGESLLLGCAARVVLLLGFTAEALSEPKLTLDASLLRVFSGALCLLDVLDTEEFLEVGAGFFGAGEETLLGVELEVLCFC